MLPLMPHGASRIARRFTWRRSLLLGCAATVLGGGAAAADTNWTTIINFDHSRVINEGDQTGNYKIWGLGYARVIYGSRGSNVIVADGACPPGSTDTDYCSEAPDSHSKSRIIHANGAGTNVIYAGYGPTVIFGGPGTNTIYALSPKGDSVFCSGPGDTVYASRTDRLHNCSHVIYGP